MNVLPEYFFTKRQVNGVKGHEVYFNRRVGWPLSLGIGKNMKEAREIVLNHKEQRDKGEGL